MIPTSAAAPAAYRLLARYQPAPGHFDELLDAAGQPKPHWKRLIAELDNMGYATLERRWQQARLLIHDNGVSYNVYGDPEGLERPWNLSPLPVVLEQEAWHELRAGMAQRARLLDALLADLYGPGVSLAEGLLPPAVVLGRPSFLRPMHGHMPPGRRWLTFYAADVIRGPDGRFQVFADRSQAPSGAGYALENRIVISQVLPEAFRDCHVERLARYFRSVQTTLAALAPHNRDNPNIVLLTPGPYNATYFEQAYLAQYLGYTLVTGDDLTVRDERVCLKTLGGLQPVDVILRRVNDDYCDPLELRPDTLLGVPGLVQACRAGHVAVANPLGTGLVRTPAMLPYLPRLCRHLLGEELRLPSVPTWWCGDPEGLAHALAHSEQMVWKPAYSSGYVHPVRDAMLSAAERLALHDKIRARPQDWVAQEYVNLSVTPVLGADGLVARPNVLRSFAVQSGDGYEVMPGAMARAASAESGFEITLQLGAVAKDVWVPSDGPVTQFSLLPPPTQPISLSRGGGDLPSRVADNLYWLGRYTERAECLSRTARVLLARLSDAESSQPMPPELALIAAGLAAQTELPFTQDEPPSSQALYALVSKALDDPQSPGSLRSTVRSTLHVARMVRDRLSLDSWKTLAALEDDLADAPATQGASPAQLSDSVQRLILRLAAFSGLAGESMTRGLAWRFLDMGRRLERSHSQSTLLRHTLAHRREREGPLLEALLEIADSGMTYRRRYLAALQVAPVVDLLLTDESNPRAVAFQVAVLDEHLGALPNARAAGSLRTHEQRVALGALTRLRLADIASLCPHDGGADRTSLMHFLDELLLDFPALSDHLTERYLSHATQSRNLSPGDRRS